jgi:hypothetical protein
MYSLGNEGFVIGGVEALDEDGLGYWHKDQVEGGLNLEDKFLRGVNVKGAELQGSSIVLVPEGTKTGGVEFAVQDVFSFAEVKGGSFLAASQ